MLGAIHETLNISLVAPHLQRALSLFANLRLIPWMKLIRPERLVTGYGCTKKAHKDKVFREIPPTARPLIDHQAGMCIWPVGGRLFCCAPSIEQYCPYHAAISIDQTKKKARAEARA